MIKSPDGRIVVIDHFSRRVMGFAVSHDKPASREVRMSLGRTISLSEAKPKYIICDKGSQFWCDGFTAWCRRRSIKPRFGAVHRHGSIAVVVDSNLFVLMPESTE